MAARFLVRAVFAGGERQRLVSEARALAKTVGVEARNPKWTSYGALEVDIFAPSQADFELFLAALQPLARIEFAKDLNRPPDYKTKEELVAEARELFNAERFWECHEALEGVWRNTVGEEKLFLQGIILLCAAFVHLQKGEDDVALSVLGRASKQLRYGTKTYYGISVEALNENAKEILATKHFDIFSI